MTSPTTRYAPTTTTPTAPKCRGPMRSSMASCTRRSHDGVRPTAVLHVGVKVEGPRDSGGEGVLALHPRDIGVSRQFDVALTWGGKHTGYLHVDVEMFQAVDTDTRRHVY